jgi:hypothetical protein
MWAQVINAVIGIWLMAAPQVLGYQGAAADNDHIFGPVIATFGIVAIADCTRNVRLFNVPLGAWLLLAPWILGYESTTSIVNDMVAGLLIMGLALIKGKVNARFGGGWSSLWQSGALHEKEAKK